MSIILNHIPEATELEAWLDTVEAYIAKPDLGSDVLQVESLLTEQLEYETQREMRTPAVEALASRGRFIEEQAYVDDSGAAARASLVSRRFADLHDPLLQRGHNLKASLALQQLLVTVKTQGKIDDFAGSLLITVVYSHPWSLKLRFAPALSVRQRRGLRSRSLS